MPAEGLLYTELFKGRGMDIPTMMRQMAARMAAEGLTYALTRDRTFNTRLAQELAMWAAATGRPSLEKAFFRAVFTEGRNVGQEDVLLAIIAEEGLPVDEARTVLADRTYRAAVDADWGRARKLGVTGVPTYVVAEPGSRQLRGVVGAQPYEALVQLATVAGAKRR